MPRQGILFILVGPSAAGKNTLMKPAQAHFGDLDQLATMTTRDMRVGEQQGREHWFVTHQEFQRLIDTDALVEYQNVHLDDFYGTPRQTVEEAIAKGRDLIADIEFLGASEILDAYAEHVVLIFVTPSNLDILAERIEHRGNVTPEEVKERLERARFEMTFAPQCHYLILNDSVDDATEQLQRIIASERARRQDTPGQDAHDIIDRHVFHCALVAIVQQGEAILGRAGDPEFAFPRFAIDRDTAPLHQTLRRRLEDMLGAPVVIQAEPDRRFDFVAPNDVTITSPPPEVGIDYYFKCSVPASVPAPDGWDWRSMAQVALPPWFSATMSAR